MAAVSFTGSTGVGISLAETCAKFLRPAFLELGGNEPLIIFDDADYEKALNETVAGRIGNAGPVSYTHLSKTRTGEGLGYVGLSTVVAQALGPMIGCLLYTSRCV